MAIKAEHEIHKRRLSRNVGVGATLLGFVVLIFALSVVKLSQYGPIEGFDHTVRPSITKEPGQ